MDWKYDIVGEILDSQRLPTRTKVDSKHGANPNKTPLATHDWWTYAEHLAVVPDCGSYNVARRSLPRNPMFRRRKYIVLHIPSRAAGAGLCHDFHKTHSSVLNLLDSCNAVRSVKDGVFERVLLNCDAMRRWSRLWLEQLMGRPKRCRSQTRILKSSPSAKTNYD
jgi:hypothetical protein